jgi:phosphatidylinositol kinase/protein kinase (PI-3  family)
MAVLENILNGEHDSIRNEYRHEKYLDTEKQVDVLLEQATDPNLLGRIWIGWSPFI